MTKRDRLPLGPRGHHIAHLHLTIIDNHPINKQFHQLATLGEGQVVERRPEAVAEGVDAMRQGQDIDLLVLATFTPDMSFPAASGSARAVCARIPRAR